MNSGAVKPLVGKLETEERYDGKATQRRPLWLRFNVVQVFE
jgi:hypothetical protein